MDSITDVVSGNLAKALEEADKLLRSPRTRVEIIALRRQMKTVTSELGRRTLQLYKDGRIEDPELAELCARIISIEARIAEREARLAQVQAQTDRQPGQQSDETGPAAEECSRCSTALPEDAVFCHKCGLKLETAAAAAIPQGRFCGQCGRELRPEAGFCPRCGAAA